jgi:hypothetical protein
MVNPTLTAAVIAAVFGALGWAAAQFFALLREGATRELNIRLKVLERQIEEFYGPLFSLTNQIHDARAVRNRLVKACIAVQKRGAKWDEQQMSWISKEEDWKTWPILDDEIDAISDAEVKEYRDKVPISTIRFYALEEFIFPLYDQANKVLAERLYLLDHQDIPDTYRAFMRHALQNRVQNRLFIDKRVPTNFTSASPYPDDFTADVERSLKKLLLEYSRLQGQVAETARWRFVLLIRLLQAVGLAPRSTEPPPVAKPGSSKQVA